MGVDVAGETAVGVAQAVAVLLVIATANLGGLEPRQGVLVTARVLERLGTSPADKGNVCAEELERETGDEGVRRRDTKNTIVNV